MLVSIVSVKLSDPDFPIVAWDALESQSIAFLVRDCSHVPHKLQPHGYQGEQAGDGVLID